jgi:predicted membrane protein
MTRTTRSALTPRIVLGLCIMAFGLLLGLDNLGVVDAGQLLRLWPAAIIAFGVVKIVQRQLFAGFVWSVVGLAILLHSLDLINAWRLWPFLLVLVGGYIVYRAVLPERRCQLPEERELGLPLSSGEDAQQAGGEQDGRIDVVAFFGGVQRTIRSQEFRGGTVVAVMGGCAIDLRNATIAGEEAVVDVTAFWGGLEIRVPDDWYVESRGVALLGGFGDKTQGPLQGGKRLVVTGMAIMGGVEIKN